MAAWQRTLNLTPEWQMRKNEEISLQELSAIVAKRLSALQAFGDEYLDVRKDDLAGEFEAMSKDASLTVDEFDGVLEELYDWGDILISGNVLAGKKVCWVKTF